MNDLNNDKTLKRVATAVCAVAVLGVVGTVATNAIQTAHVRSAVETLKAARTAEAQENENLIKENENLTERVDGLTEENINLAIIAEEAAESVKATDDINRELTERVDGLTAVNNDLTAATETLKEENEDLAKQLAELQAENEKKSTLEKYTLTAAQKETLRKEFIQNYSLDERTIKFLNSFPTVEFLNQFNNRDAYVEWMCSLCFNFEMNDYTGSDDFHLPKDGKSYLTFKNANFICAKAFANRYDYLKIRNIYGADVPDSVDEMNLHGKQFIEECTIFGMNAKKAIPWKYVTNNDPILTEKLDKLSELLVATNISIDNKTFTNVEADAFLNYVFDTFLDRDSTFNMISEYGKVLLAIPVHSYMMEKAFISGGEPLFLHIPTEGNHIGYNLFTRDDKQEKEKNSDEKYHVNDSFVEIISKADAENCYGTKEEMVLVLMKAKELNLDEDPSEYIVPFNTASKQADALLGITTRELNDFDTLINNRIDAVTRYNVSFRLVNGARRILPVAVSDNQYSSSIKTETKTTVETEKVDYKKLTKEEQVVAIEKKEEIKTSYEKSNEEIYNKANKEGVPALQEALSEGRTEDVQKIAKSYEIDLDDKYVGKMGDALEEQRKGKENQAEIEKTTAEEIAKAEADAKAKAEKEAEEQKARKDEEEALIRGEQPQNNTEESTVEPTEKPAATEMPAGTSYYEEHQGELIDHVGLDEYDESIGEEPYIPNGSSSIKERLLNLRAMLKQIPNLFGEPGSQEQTLSPIKGKRTNSIKKRNA